MQTVRSGSPKIGTSARIGTLALRVKIQFDRLDFNLTTLEQSQSFDLRYDFHAFELHTCSFGFCARAPNPENPDDPLEAALSPPPPPGAVFLRKSKRPPPPAVAAGAGAAAAEDAPEKPENAEKALGPS